MRDCHGVEADKSESDKEVWSLRERSQETDKRPWRIKTRESAFKVLGTPVPFEEEGFVYIFRIDKYEGGEGED
jgi:hypothetical protein